MPYKFNPFTGILDYYEAGGGGGGGSTVVVTHVANYAALPDPTTVADDEIYIADAAQGTAWLPGSLGGTYYPAGFYSSDGTSWIYAGSAAQATLSEVNTGTNNDKFVTPSTFTNADKWGTKADKASITGATKTKITYNADGIVTAGADATTADISDSVDKRYVTDSDLTVIGNTSGTNTGDQTSVVGITGTKSQFNTSCTDGDFAYQSDLSGLVPYTGATAELDLGTYNCNAQAMHIKGTAGNGHLGLRKQTSNPSASANESSIFADTNGNFGWKNDSLFATILQSHLITANRTYTLPDRTGTLADDTDLGLKANLASPALTGTPTAPTQSASDNSTKIATTAYVDSAVSSISSSGGTELGLVMAIRSGGFYI